MSDDAKNLDVLLIADDSYRVAMLRQAMQQQGLNCTIRPDLVLFDLAEPDADSVELLRDVAFGSRRSEVPVVLLTSPASEPMLESGEIDEGQATMFSPRSLQAFLTTVFGSP